MPSWVVPYSCSMTSFIHILSLFKYFARVIFFTCDIRSPPSCISAAISWMTFFALVHILASFVETHNWSTVRKCLLKPYWKCFSPPHPENSLRNPHYWAICPYLFKKAQWNSTDELDLVLTVHLCMLLVSHHWQKDFKWSNMEAINLTVWLCF